MEGTAELRAETERPATEKAVEGETSTAEKVAEADVSPQPKEPKATFEDKPEKKYSDKPEKKEPANPAIVYKLNEDDGNDKDSGEEMAESGEDVSQIKR